MGTRALWRFDEYAASQRPRDAIAAVADMTQIPPYFQSGAQISSLIGGVWKGGWSADQGAATISPIFGGVTFGTPVGTLAYSPGALGGSDKAFAFNTAGTSLDGGNNYDVGANDDLGLMWVGKWTAPPPAYGTILSKVSAAFGNGWALTGTDGSLISLSIGAGGGGIVGAYVGPGTGQPEGYAYGDWHLGLAGMDRTSTKARLVIVNLRSLVVTISTLNTITPGSASVGNSVVLGNSPWVAANYSTFQLSQFYIAHGVGAFAGIPTDLQARALAAANALLSAPAVVDAATGRGRSFVAQSRHGYEGADVVAGSTLLTRDASVQALVKWDFADQAASMGWLATKIGNVEGAWDTGASSVESFVGDGGVEWTQPTMGGNQAFIVGLCDVDTASSYNDIDRGIFCDGVSQYRVLDLQAVVLTAACTTGDVFRVMREGTAVKYYKNGVVVWTSGAAISATLPLFVDTSIAYLTSVNPTSQIREIRRIVAGAYAPITWQRLDGERLDPLSNIAGTLYAHGKGTAAADFLSAGVELRVVNPSSGVGELRWLWQNAAGTLKRQAGGYFAAPTDGSSVLLTATRRWVSPTSAILRYFVGGQMLAEVETADGDIGGGTAGVTTIGARYDGAAWVDFFDGVIDELRVVDYELTPEEIAATWRRIAELQPDGYRTMRDLMQPGLPISDDPSSRVQSDLRTLGNALGYGSSQVENVRDNLMPDRAYGAVLNRWERITQKPAKPTDSVDKRRARVVGHLGKRDGVSPPGVQNALAELFAMRAADIPIIAFDNTIREQWAALEGERWLTAVNGTSVNTIAGALLTKSGGVNATWDSGASASTRIIGDGRIDVFAPLPAANEQKIFGFTDLVVPLHNSATKWALQFGRTANNSLDVRESDAVVFSTTFAVNDWLTVRRRGRVVEYMKNETVIYTSTIPAVGSLAADFSLFNTTPSYFQNIRLTKDAASEVELLFDLRANVTFTLSSVQPWGSRLKKIGGATGNVTDNTIQSTDTIAGDGYVEAVADAAVSAAGRLFGLSVAGSALGFAGIQYAWYLLSDSTLRVYESGVDRGLFGSPYAAGDVLRVERIGSTVVYKKNGAIVYTSAIATLDPLCAVAVMEHIGGTTSSLDAVRLYDNGVRIPPTWGTAINVSTTNDALRVAVGGATNAQWDQSAFDGIRCIQSVESSRAVTGANPFNALHAFCAVDPITLATSTEAGIVLWDPTMSPQMFLFFGVRNNAGTFQVGYELFRGAGDGNPNTAWTVLATTSLTKHWLRLRPFTGSFGGASFEHPYQLSWSTTGNAEAQLSSSGLITWRRPVGWWGFYTRTIGGSSGGAFDVRFSEVQMRNALGTRPFYWYALRDPSLPGVPDMQSARVVAGQLAQAFTIGRVCSRRSFLLDDPLCTCDGGPMGGL